MTNDDWKAAEDAFMQNERERLGGPPRPEEIAALLRGELSDREAARVRALAVYYPALTDVLLENGPAAEPAASSPEDLSREWDAIQRRLSDSHPPPQRTIARTLLPLAAMLVVGFAAGLLVHSLEREAPQLFEVPHELHPVGVRRGPDAQSAHPLTADEDNYLLVLMLARETDYPRYRVDIVAAESSGSKILWTSSALRRVEDRPFTIAVPRSFLRPGSYRLELYGLDSASHHLATYTVRVSP